jgi:hypothetical protein
VRNIFRGIVTFFFLLIGYNFVAQEDNHQNFYLEPVYQYGFIWQHRPSLAEVIGGNINVARISFGKTTFGQSYWEQLYRYPDWGIGYSFTDLGNPDELGQANSIYYYLRIPVIKKTKFSLSYKISGGLAWLNKGNIAIGSHINLYFDASLDAKFKLSKRLQLINSFGATHYSNGAIEMPNLGVNLFSYRIGLQCKLNPEEREKITMEVPEVYGKSALTIVVGAGVKEKRPLGGEKFTVASGSVDYMKVFSLKHKFGAGIDVFYDETLFELQNPDSTLNLTNQDIIRYGIHLSAEAQYKKLVLAVHIGTYLHANYTDDGKIYQRVALRYLLTKNLFANISLKTSKGVADFVEWGLGYQFYRK